MVDQFIVVIEPGARSVQTYEKVKKLAADLGIHKVRVVANKIRDDSDREFIRSRIPEADLLGFIRYNGDVIDADRKGLSLTIAAPRRWRRSAPSRQKSILKNESDLKGMNAQ